MADGGVIHQGDFFKLSESRKLFIGSKSDSWKPRYIIVRAKESVPVLELHKKKPKTSKKSDKTLLDSYELPAFKVEKLKNARGRTFVCEITAPNVHLFLSTDAEKQIDVLVFLLQTQLRLKDEIRDDIIRVVPEDSECQKKIGAKGSNCLIHISPWGLTLVLERSRCLLAQWPLKSIRYYESSGSGHFTIEAGRVAPMGEGVFGFQTLLGDDDTAYDRVDNYIVNTLDRVRPNQRGTREEIDDYIREHDHLHALTNVNVTSISQRDIQKALKLCWNEGTSRENFTDAVLERRGAVSPSPESSVRNSSSSTHTSSLNVTLERVNMSDSASSRSEQSSADSRRSSLQVDAKSSNSRPPLPNSKFHNGGVPRRSRRREHSIPRKIDVPETDTYGSSPRLAHRDQLSGSEHGSPELPPRPMSSAHPRRHSNPSNVINSVNNSDQNFNLHPYVNQQHQHTEFYHLSSPNLKVRKPKSPIVTPHPNKVGRAELLLSSDHSGLKTPSTSSPPTLDNRGFGRWDLSGAHAADEDHKEAQDYMDAVARATQEKYGGHNSIDRSWVKMRRDLSGGDVQSGSVSPGYVNTFPPTGYVNIQKLASMEEDSRQSSHNSLEKPSSGTSRQNSNTSHADSTLSPPVIRHSRQRSAPVESTSSIGSVTASNQGYLVLPDGSEVPLNDFDVNLRDNRERQNSEGRATEGSSRHASELSGFSSFDQLDGPVAEWLVSASCEDLSDHMRHVIYDKEEDEGKEQEKDAKEHGREENEENTYDEIHSDKEEKSDAAVSTSTDKPPLPFTGLKKFQNKTDLGSQRDRSKSFGYVNAMPATSSKPQSSAPSAHLIRKMVAARAKQENTLRKSLSNPNFLNLGSKEHLFNAKTVSGTMGSSSSNLQANAKQKSRSFGSLFPAIKKALSRESLGHSRSTTPERRSSFSLRRRSSEHELRRQNSLHSVGEMSIKGIRMTERSRSFRRVRGAKSVEVLSKPDNEDDSRFSTATNISAPPNLHTQMSEPVPSSTKLPNNNNTSTMRSLPGSRQENELTLPSKSPEKSRHSAPISPKPVSPMSPSKTAGNSSFTSSIHIKVSESSDSMSPAPSPSHLPPPPLPARKPRKSDGNSIAASSSISSSASSVQNQNRASNSSNYMNSISIKVTDNNSKERRESSTGLSKNRSKRRISDKSDIMNVVDFVPGAQGQDTPKEATGVRRSSAGSQIYATSSKKAVPSKSRSSKVGAKS